MRRGIGLNYENRHAIKCDCCRKAYRPVKIDQKYCSPACRQKAYRQRQKAGKKPAQRRERLLHQQTCNHCTGSFLTSAHNAKFCSTSCRTLHHRAMKKAIAPALVNVIGLPEVAALDQIETQQTRRLRRILEQRGMVYQHQRREWIPSIELMRG